MDTTIFTNLYECLMSGKGVVLIRIIRRKGSAPRDVGSACMVDADGKLFGSIGGGQLEHKAIEKAMGLIRQQKTSTDAIELTAESIENEGMICGGWVELFLEPILPEDPTAVELFGRLVDLVRNGGSGMLITRVSNGTHALTPDSRMLVEKDGSETGAIYQELTKNGISEQALSKIHSPIGLNIGAQTPEEIAISIIAEIIKVKADLAAAGSLKGALNVQCQRKN